ncbi:MULTISPECIES: sugar-transfer associated ATP-grasp domain-containing protein [unclassified Microbacterium]|uniref:sugar-transfer associated ATP-grasp domain-containing protein n=1 Tax=unclassified Microbacterium TaxID=2609290 RepID=UPI00214B0873|nr:MULTISPECIES: sugar-transfer associated ATP-grasp domain-containing protein [unclassified Microbacterium]MCR2785618.1 flagellar biosynthesis protein [Microbacterium sp. zg.B96]WIM17397.1 sugar-transfer associated ATP-grasp domain-containing protein [Microbacterium sp. zg-B96]
MASRGLALQHRLRVLLQRARNIDVSSVTDRARRTAKIHGKSYPVVLADMLWSAARHRVGFNDYLEFDFAILTRAERATWVTSPLALELSNRFDDAAYVHTFHHKVEFNRAFDRFLGREWLELTEGNAAELEAFASRHPVLIGKEPVSKSGLGVRRYFASDVSDWSSFHAELLARGEVLIEEKIEQHPDIAATCPGTVNTTRVTTFVKDDGTVEIINMAQKFGRGQVSDQGTFGGFYTVLDENGHAQGKGYDIHGNLFETHPETGYRIADFQLPMMDQVRELITEVALVVPQVRYVGWDIVVGPDAPLLVEGNWGAGVFENKPTATGIRHGHLPRYRAAMGF